MGGRTLIKMNAQKALMLHVPVCLIPRLLADIKAESQESHDQHKENVKSWHEGEVWRWIESKSYEKELDNERWKFVDGNTLLRLNANSISQLGVPKPLILRL